MARRPRRTRSATRKARLAITSKRSCDALDARVTGLDVLRPSGARGLGDERGLLAHAVDTGDFRSGNAIAMTTPGNPAPLPTSTRRSPRPSPRRRPSAAAAARQSRMCWTTMLRGSRIGSEVVGSVPALDQPHVGDQAFDCRDGASGRASSAAPRDTRSASSASVGRKVGVAALKRRRWRARALGCAPRARSMLPDVHQQERHRRRRHPGQPRRGPDGGRALRVERLARFERQGADRLEVEVDRNHRRLALRGSLDIRLLLLDIARIPRGRLDLVDHLVGELAAGLRAQRFT